MLEQVLTHLHNWFPACGGKHRGTFRVVCGALEADFLQEGQRFRIRGSIFNDGLHMHPARALHDETFTGEVWTLAIPPAVIALADEIAAWYEKNPETDKVSESFGGYSYTRSAVGTASGASLTGWQAAFAGRLNPYRRPYDD